VKKKKQLTIHEQAELTKHTLLTNVSFIQISEGVRINCYAILIEEGAISLGDPVDEIRFFGTEPSAEHGKIWLKEGQLPYTIEQTEDKSFIMLTHDDKMKPIFSGSYLILADGTRYYINCEDQDRPLDVFKIRGNVDEVWKQLKLKTAEYWIAPYMPLQQYFSADNIRRAYKENPDLCTR